MQTGMVKVMVINIVKKNGNGDNDCNESDDTVGDDGSDEENNGENNHE